LLNKEVVDILLDLFIQL